MVSGGSVSPPTDQFVTLTGCALLLQASPFPTIAGPLVGSPSDFATPASIVLALAPVSTMKKKVFPFNTTGASMTTPALSERSTFAGTVTGFRATAWDGRLGAGDPEGAGPAAAESLVGDPAAGCDDPAAGGTDNPIQAPVGPAGVECPKT